MISAALVLLVLAREQDWVRLQLRQLKIHPSILWKIICVGIPAALQMAVTAFSNVFVQSYINHFGPDCMSGWTAYTKMDQLMLLPMQSLALAATTFVGQNLGIGQVDRAKKGARTACLAAIIITAVMMLALIPAAPYLVHSSTASRKWCRQGLCSCGASPPSTSSAASIRFTPLRSGVPATAVCP